MSIKLNPISGSSQIAAVGHDPDTNTLAVQFRSGQTYHYHDVPEEKFHGLQKAESAGKYLNAHIKGAHTFTKQ